MKRLVAIVLLVALIVLLSGCAPKGKVKIAGVWVDKANVDKYDFNVKGIEADIRGDSYCKKCDKFMEGKVRICKYCGQYI